MRPIVQLCLVPTLLLASCVTPQPGPASWWQETAGDLGGKLGGCCLGDFDSQNPGNEIGVVAGDGRVVCLSRSGRGWSQEVVATLPGEQIQCIAGDLLPQYPGDELVTVGVLRGGEESGAPGAAYVHWKDAQGWHSELILQDRALLHCAAFGEVDGEHPGPELVLAGFSGRVHVLHREGEELLSESLGPLPGNAKGAAVGLGGVVLACDDGSLCAMRRGDAGWQLETLEQFTAPLARVAARSNMALVCANDGRLYLLDDEGLQSIVVSEDRLRGAAIVDMLAESPGDELATAGYDGLIRILSIQRASGSMQTLGVQAGDPIVNTTVVGRDENRLHHLAAGSLGGLGTCLVTCGYSGRVLVVGRLR